MQESSSKSRLVNVMLLAIRVMTTSTLSCHSAIPLSTTLQKNSDYHLVSQSQDVIFQASAIQANISPPHKEYNRWLKKTQNGIKTVKTPTNFSAVNLVVVCYQLTEVWIFQNPCLLKRPRSTL